MGRALGACERWQNFKKNIQHQTRVRRAGRPKLRWEDCVDQDMSRGKELEEGRPQQRRMGKAS